MPHLVWVAQPWHRREQSQCQVMMNDAELASVPPAPFTDQLRLAEGFRYEKGFQYAGSLKAHPVFVSAPSQTT